MAQITCKNLAVGYGGQAVLKNLSFSVQRGDCLYILGENGCGKTTLMKTLLRLLPPVGGSVELSDGLSPNDIGYLPQQTLIQPDFPASVSEIVLSGCQNRCGLRPFYSKAEKALAHNAMAKTDVLSLAGRCYRELSGGQQQRVLLARALCAARKVLVLDEPVSGLDSQAAANLYQLIQELHREEGVTVLVISHDLSAAVQSATHILYLGHSTFFGTRQEFLRSPQWSALKGVRNP